MYIVIIHILETPVKEIGMGNGVNPLFSDQMDMETVHVDEDKNPMPKHTVAGDLGR
jgi:hypothetical protein